MSADSFTEVSEQSWLNRGCSSIFGIIFGVVMVIIAFPLLFWNEGRAVERYNSLQEGAGVVISISADRVDPANEGQLVHLTGLATTNETLSDAEFDVSAQALKLEREVEMYQWEENKSTKKVKKTGGGTRTETTYSYEKVWSSRQINSQSFNRPDGHENPDSMLYSTQVYVADNITVGSFTLSRSLVEQLDNFEALRIDPSSSRIPAAIESKAKLIDGQIYVGNDPQAPQIGDLRIGFNTIQPTTLSLVAKQVQQSFQTYQTNAGGTVQLLEIGSHDAASMFDTAQSENTILTWILRLVGFVIMWIGFQTILKPLSVLFDVIPFLGNIVGAGIGFITFPIAAAFSLITISIAWIFYRPLLAIGLLAIGLALIGGAFALTRRRTAETPV